MKPPIVRSLPLRWDHKTHRLIVPRRKCAETRQSGYANDSPGVKYLCTLNATVSWDGDFLCKRHAGIRSLNYLMYGINEDTV